QSGPENYTDDRDHNKANELIERDIASGPTYTPSYDEVGNLIDDGKTYKYVYDPFGRMRKILLRSDDSLVVEYRYNGLGHRIASHYDVNLDGDVDTDDAWYYFMYDERWRVIATYRAPGTAPTDLDADPKERFVYHNAGYAGYGGSSYIDDVILRDKDANSPWRGEADGTLEERIYYCQNWRHDVVALIDSSGGQIEQTRYSSYGIPFGLPAGDA